MGTSTSKTVKIFCVMLVLAGLVIGGFYFLTNHLAETKSTSKSNEVKTLKEKDLDTGYPAIPTEVIKMYNRINKCMYNENLKDEDFDALLDQMRILFDEDFLKENPRDTHKENFERDVESFSKEKKSVVNTVVQENSQVQYQTIDKKECASLVSSYMIKEKGEYVKTYEQFVLRKDSDGKWKIYGWDLTNAAAFDSTEAN